MPFEKDRLFSVVEQVDFCGCQSCLYLVRGFVTPVFGRPASAVVIAQAGESGNLGSVFAQGISEFLEFSVCQWSGYEIPGKEHDVRRFTDTFLEGEVDVIDRNDRRQVEIGQVKNFHPGVLSEMIKLYGFFGQFQPICLEPQVCAACQGGNDSSHEFFEPTSSRGGFLSP